MLAGYNEKGASIWCLNNCIQIEWRKYKLIRESNVDEYKKKMRMQRDSKPTPLKKSTTNKQEE